MKITEEIQKRMDDWNVTDDGKALYIFPDCCVGLVYNKKHLKIPEPKLYINICPKLNKKEFSGKIFRYKKQNIKGELIINAIQLIYGKYKKDIILKLGVTGEPDPMWCIIQTPTDDYEFVIAPFCIENVDIDKYDYFDIEKNQTTKINYKRIGLKL